MHRGLVIALALSAGCRSVFGLEEPVPGHAARDGAPDANPLCFGTAPALCVSALPSEPIALDSLFDTDTSNLCVTSTQLDGPDLCLVVGAGVKIASFTVVGSRPLAIVSTDAIFIEGKLDVSSALQPMPHGGAGANAVAGVDGANTSSIGGGGAGGSFGSKGGSGGAGGNGGGLGGIALDTGPVLVLRGGGAGGTGGIGDNAGGGGLGGSSGGAVALISRVSIEITLSGSVFASGAGGGRGNPNNQNKGAGGGGGSGGMIVLEAPAITNDGIVAANGGGGGGGGDCCAGNPGADGTTTQYDVVAPGGLNEGNSHGGIGGAGAAGITPAAPGLPPGGGGSGGNGGGGGGGGGHGIVIVRGELMGAARFSPTPIP